MLLKLVIVSHYHRVLAERWTVEDLSSALQVPATALRRKMAYWQSQGLLKEESTDTFLLVEEHKGRSQDVIAEEEAESAMASVHDQREEELQVYIFQFKFGLNAGAPPGWLIGECVGSMTWWLRVRDPVESKFLCSVFSPLTSAEACEKSSQWPWKEICVSTGVRKPGNIYASPTAMI